MFKHYLHTDLSLSGDQFIVNPMLSGLFPPPYWDIRIGSIKNDCREEAKSIIGYELQMLYLRKFAFTPSRSGR